MSSNIYVFQSHKPVTLISFFDMPKRPRRLYDTHLLENSLLRPSSSSGRNQILFESSCGFPAVILFVGHKDGGSLKVHSILCNADIRRKKITSIVKTANTPLA